MGRLPRVREVVAAALGLHGWGKDLGLAERRAVEDPEDCERTPNAEVVMFCSNCQSEVDAPNGYCSRCGMAIGARLCPNGHVMDPSWSECQYCPPGARGAVGIPPPPAKGRTVVESQGGGFPPPGGFVKGATLLEGPFAGSGKGATVVEGPAVKGKTLLEGSGGGSKGKQRTVFDPGLSPTAPMAGPGPAVPAAPKPKLVGWLVTFSLNASGSDFRLREGRNVIGADASECDIAVEGASSVSGRHAVIMFRDGKFQLRDNDSTNGTYLNGEDIFGQGAVTLSDRDVVKLGEVELVLVAL